MNLSTNRNEETGKIEAYNYKVSDHARLGSLPRHFGRLSVIVEGRIYDHLRQFSPQYDGGHWALFELSNGGFFMAPPEARYHLTIPGNGYDGDMSATAAGITVCLFCFSHLSFEFRGTDVFTRHFYRLRDFALKHVESAEIIAAID